MSEQSVDLIRQLNSMTVMSAKLGYHFNLDRETEKFLPSFILFIAINPEKQPHS
jgi:hypothetical protein